MNRRNKIIPRHVRAFAPDEDGTAILEYALIIAVVSIVLVLALNGMTTGNYFDTFIGRLSSCLNTTTCI